MERNNIVNRSQSGKLLISPKKIDRIERSVVHHLEVLHRRFERGQYDENKMRNMDETHFVINCDNGTALGLRGDTKVKYADVESVDNR
ncbi:unnamed protein product [Peronospora effusa]|nr:unnamed protein product [Peronospora effusa]